MSRLRIISRCALALSLALAAQSSAFADGEEPEQPDDGSEQPSDADNVYAEPGAWKILGQEGPAHCPVNVAPGVIIQLGTHRHGNGPLEVGGELAGTAQRNMPKITASGLEVQLKAICATAPNENVQFIESEWFPIYQSRVDGEISCPADKPVLMGMSCWTRTQAGSDAKPK